MTHLLFNALPLAVWLQAIGRGLYQFGSAMLLFYMPIVFVNYGHLSATQVGLAIGGGSVAGFVGNLIGGGLTDAPRVGRKGTLLLGIGLAIAAAILATLARGFGLLLGANVAYGLSSGLYWTAADAAVMDATEPSQRQSAFSVLGVLDSVGFGAGILAGQSLLQVAQPALIFAVSAVLFVCFLVLTVAIRETPLTHTESHFSAGWKQALTDGRLMIYLLVNTLFIGYLALINVSLPLYWIKETQTSEATIASLFTWGFVGLGALLQIPIVRWIAPLSYLRSLMISMGVWGIGFGLVWRSGMTQMGQLGVFAVFAIATVIYKPTSSAWIGELAPSSLRGVYTAIAYQCWSIGYAIAPVLGGWALDQPRGIQRQFWLVVALSTLFGIMVLQILQRFFATAMETAAIQTESAAE
jgi:MFS family permease